MPELILPADDFKRLIRDRRARGIDHHDEVWNGVYVIPPITDNEHQWIAVRLTILIHQTFGESDAVRVFPGTNVTDRPSRWEKNYRCPDVAVFLPGNPAEDRGTHWLGGPDFATEVVSRYDHSRKKLPFYARVGVRELMFVERTPWRLELYRRGDGVLEPAGTSDPGSSASLVSTVLGLAFRLLPASPRPRLEVTRLEDQRIWFI